MDLKKTLESIGISVLQRNDLSAVHVQNPEEGIGIAKNVLYSLCDKKTVLFLSGGSTPKPLYEQLAHEEKLNVGAVGMIDERYGDPGHAKSNEKMIKETGLLRYLTALDIQFSPILKYRHPGVASTTIGSQFKMRDFIASLQNDKTGRKETADRYDEEVRSFFFNIPTHIGILGIGEDGHTAGIAPNRSDFKNPLFEKNRQSLLVSEFIDPTGPFGERVTMTFQGLSMLDVLIVLVMGSAKQNALREMFNSGSLAEIPSRFYTQPEIGKKTIVITDQII